MIDVMDKINRIQRRQVMISCGIFLALLIPFLVVQFATMISSDLTTLAGEWFFPFFIIMICANIGLSLGMRHLTSRRCRAVLEESNGKCE